MCLPTPVAWSAKLPGVAGLAVDVAVLAVAEVPGAQGFAAGVTGGAPLVVDSTLDLDSLGVKYLQGSVTRIYRYHEASILCYAMHLTNRGTIVRKLSN